jgi:putative transposase
VAQFRDRSLSALEFPYVFLDATYCKARVNHRVVSQAIVVAVGVFPNPAALLRLAGAVLVEQHDEWEAGDRRYFSESSMLELKTMNDPTVVVEEVTPLPELIAA